MLGVEWLLSLGPVISDFAELKMDFSYEGKAVCFKGLKYTTELVDDKELSSITNVGSKGLWLQLLSSIDSSYESIMEVEISELLHKYTKVFDEPSGLPP